MTTACPFVPVRPLKLGSNSGIDKITYDSNTNNNVKSENQPNHNPILPTPTLQTITDRLVPSSNSNNNRCYNCGEEGHLFANYTFLHSFFCFFFVLFCFHIFILCFKTLWLQFCELPFSQFSIVKSSVL
jgi:hypothetical protein